MKKSNWQKILIFSMGLPGTILTFVFLLNKAVEIDFISKKTFNIIMMLFLFQIILTLVWYGKTKKN